MPFHRFEGMESHRFNPHLSSAVGPVIEGEYLYFRLVTKSAGTGARMHYHPNELMAFPLKGAARCCVGDERQVVTPGTLVHMPPYAQHELFATDDGDLTYLYVKDRTWDLHGTAVDDRAIASGLGECYYRITDTLGAARASGHFERWLEGTYFAFGFVESPHGRSFAVERVPHETFLYVVGGSLRAEVGGEKRDCAAGDVVHVPRGAPFAWRVASDEGVSYAAVRSLPRLESAVAEHGAADNWRG